MVDHRLLNSAIAKVQVLETNVFALQRVYIQ